MPLFIHEGNETKLVNAAVRVLDAIESGIAFLKSEYLAEKERSANARAELLKRHMR